MDTVDFMNDLPPIDGAHIQMFNDIVYEMNLDLDGSIHHDPIQEPTS